MLDHPAARAIMMVGPTPQLLMYGFASGALLGVAVISLETTRPAEPVAEQFETEVLPESSQPPQAPAQVAYPVEQDPIAARAEQMLASGRPLSLREMMMLQEILEARGTGAGYSPTYSYDADGDDYPASRSAQASSSTAVGYGSQRAARGPASSSYESASREWLRRNGADLGISSVVEATTGASGSTAGALNPHTGEYYAPAGKGYVSSRDGTYYAPSGPSGVINTRTGEYVPVAP